MAYKPQYNTKVDTSEPPRCPHCGTVLELKLLEFKDDPDILLLLDCPRGDYHGTVTSDDITSSVTAEVMKRLR